MSTTNNATENLPTDLRDEIEAINAIYGPNTLVPHGTGPSSSSSTNNPSPPQAQANTLLLTPPEEHPLHPVSLLLAFPPSYPEDPPSITGPHSVGASLPKGTGARIAELSRGVLEGSWTRGEVCVFAFLSDLESLLQETSLVQDEDDDDTHDDPGEEREAAARHDDDHHHQQFYGGEEQQDTFPAPEWVVSAPVSEKKSLFVAHACAVASPAEARHAAACLLRSDRKIAAATHNVRAWRVKTRVPAAANTKDASAGSGSGKTGSKGKGVGRKGGGDGDRGGGGVGEGEGEGALATREIMHQDRDSDGESAAGGRLLSLMQLMDADGVLVVVSRWYGGVKLGPDRFRIIAACAREVLVKGGWGGKEGKGKK